MKKYRYTTLIKKYEKDLINNLRDFNSEDEFLRLWVPDQDVNKSIVNLLFSFTENNLNNGSVYFDNEHQIKSIDNKKIINIFKNNANIRFLKKNDGLILFFEKIKSSYKQKIVIPNVKIKKTKKFDRIISLSNDYDDYYLSSIKKYKYKDFTKKYNKENTSLICIEEKNENINLVLFINSKNYRVINCYFENVKNLNKEKVIFYNLMCEFFINLPIYEIKDHSLIRLENFIRPKNMNKKVKGIILPVFNSKLFSETQTLINNIYFKFIKINSDIPSVNEYDYEVNENWKKLKPENQKLSISRIIKAYEIENKIKKGSIKFKKIDFNTRITVSILEKNIDKQGCILGLEIYLRKVVDKRIELFYEEQMDKNKLRIKNSPQKL
tara:strand:- start:194 stop:1336 length:1143 start_codon:yes stop_codon:yes gene_type:complete